MNIRFTSGAGLIALVAYSLLVACGESETSGSPSDADAGGGGGADAGPLESDGAVTTDGGSDAGSGGRGFKAVSLAFRGAAVPEAIALGEDDNLYWGSPSGSLSWQWKKLTRTGNATSPPDSVAWGNARIDYAVLGDCAGNTGTSCQGYWEDLNAADGGAPPEWSIEFDLGEPAGGLKPGLALASPASQRLFLFGTGMADTAHGKYWNGGVWSAWEAIPGSPAFIPNGIDAIGSVSTTYETTTLIGRDTTGAIATATHLRTLSSGVTEWLGWSTLPALANGTGRPSITRRIDIGLDPLVVYSRGGANGRLHRTRGSLDYDGSSMWKDWTEVTGGPTPAGDVDCASPGQVLIAGGTNARDYCGVIGPNGAVWLFQTVDGTTFEWRELPLHD
jgi:hypothetical protein